MAQFEVFADQQPWELQQAPSPTDERDDPTPLQLALQRTRSPSLVSPTSPTRLERQLSGDPESPPPAWKRRPSVNTQRSGYSFNSDSATSSSNASSPPPNAWYGPIPQGQTPLQRRQHHPNLQMTRAGVAQRLIREEGSPRASQLRPPPPPGAYGRRRAGTNPGSNRSSMASFEGMNSEELWSLEDGIPDMSNPTRLSQERPLDTVNRMTNRWDAVPLPEALWPHAPPDMPDYLPPPKTKSLTNVAGMKKRHTLRKSASRASTIDSSLAPMPHKDALSSAHSSVTDLSINLNKSQASLSSRPQSMMIGSYGFDLLSTLAPRDGGYAVAAQLSQNNTFSPTSSGQSDRGSFYGSPPPNSYRNSRGPPSASMMRVDDEPPLPGRLSTATTSSNLSTYAADEPLDGTVPAMAAAHMSLPAMKSPLSQQTTAAEFASMPPPMTPVQENVPQQQRYNTPAPIPVNATLAPSSNGSPVRTKTKKEVKAEEKAKAKAAKAEAKREAERREKEKAEAVQEAARKRTEAAREASRLKAEEKARAKADKASKRQSKLFSTSNRSSSNTAAATAAAAAVASVASPPPVPSSTAPSSGQHQQQQHRPEQGGLQQPPQRPTPPQTPSRQAPPPQGMSQAPQQAIYQAVPQALQGHAPLPPSASASAMAQAPVAPVLATQAPLEARGSAGVPVPNGPAMSNGNAMPNGAPMHNGMPNDFPISPGPPPAIVVPPRSSSNRAPPTEPSMVPAAAAAGAAGAVGVAGVALAASQMHQHAPPPPPAQARMPNPSSQLSSLGADSPSMTRPTPSPQSSHLRASPTPSSKQSSIPPTPKSAPSPTPPSRSSSAVASTPLPGSRARTPSAVSITPSSARSATSSSRTPTNGATDSGSATSTVPKVKKSGLFSNLKKRFSVVQLDQPATPQKARPASMAIPNGVQQRNVTAPPAPIHEAPRHLTPATAAVQPVHRPLPPTPPPKQQQQQTPASIAAAGSPMTRMAAIPPPVIVPPRQSSLARGPEQQPELEDSDHQRQASLSDPSSVVVTPTTSMATNSSPSLFEVRPAVMREDSVASGSEAGYESAISDVSGKPLRQDAVPNLVAPGHTVAAH